MACENLIACLLLVASATTAVAQRPATANRAAIQHPAPPRWAVQPELAAKLTSPFQSTSSGAPLRDLVHSIAAVGQFNLWFDRQLDSAAGVSLAAGPQTVFQSLQQIAGSCGAQVVVADNVVLFGQPQRVRLLAGALWGLPLDQPQTDLAWPPATTPSEALSMTGITPYQLPHDHWTSVHWRQLSPATAALLITAQFDQMPPTGNTGIGGQLVPLASPAELTLAYPPPLASPASLLQAATRVDRRAQVQDGGLMATVTGHLAAQEHWLASTFGPADSASSTKALPNPASVDIDRVRFTLTLESARARTALQQLAAAAGRELQVAPAAEPALARLIDLKRQDQSLRQIASAIAEAAGVTLRWTDKVLHVE